MPIVLMTQMLESVNTYFKSAIITMLHKVNKNTLEINGKINVLSREIEHKVDKRSKKN